MATSREDEKSRRKLTQLKKVLNDSRTRTKSQSNLYEPIIENIIEEDFDINYKTGKRWTLDRCISFGSGDTYCYDDLGSVLHSIIYKSLDDTTIFNSLLEHGADFTIKNENGQTALHMVMTLYEHYNKITNIHLQYVYSILSYHVKFGNFDNPQDNEGISHFHGACAVNHTQAIGWFLDNGIPIHESVSVNSPCYAGYTSLHFAAEFASFEATELLMSRGAQVDAKDARGMTPLDVCTRHRLNNLEIINCTFDTNDAWETSLQRLSDSEKMIKLFMDKQCHSSVGLSNFHIACTLKDLTTAENLSNQQVDVNHTVPTESPICPGYTAAHFASFNSVEAIKMVAKLGAKLDTQDADGFMPLDICAKNFSLKDIREILSSSENCKNIVMSDNKTTLLDFLQFAENSDELTSFLRGNINDLIVPVDSVFLPGSTILHLAVIFSTTVKYRPFYKDYNTEIMKLCLRRGPDVHVKNSRGETPIHLAFRLGKNSLVELLFRSLRESAEVFNHVDKDNLSYLHIACTLFDEHYANQLLLTNSKPDIVYTGTRIHLNCIEPGWTPLHVVACFAHKLPNYINIADLMLRHGANIHGTDAYGLTPIHWLLKSYRSYFSSNSETVSDCLFKALCKTPKDVVVDNLGLTYLHVASVYGHLEAIGKLLDVGSDVNASINYNFSSFSEKASKHLALSFLRKYSMFTPLYCASGQNKSEARSLLMLRGAADYYLQQLNSSESGVVLKNNDIITRSFVKSLWNLDDVQQLMEQRYGLTKLHVACFKKEEKAVIHALNDPIDVNAKIYPDSPLFPGCTPLHLLTMILEPHYYYQLQSITSEACSIVTLLVSHGVDVTVKNAAGDTPIHVCYKYLRHYISNVDRSALLSAHRNFNVNPVNADGVSHFHIACYWHQVDVVENFLQHGSVDVNQAIDSSDENNPGCTALHLALNHDMDRFTAGPNGNWPKLSQLVDLLLEYGASVDANDTYGNTPLHMKAVLSPRGINILEKLVSFGADIKSENVEGQTPLEMWSFTNWNDYLRIFQKNGSSLNCFNRLSRTGYMGKILLIKSQTNVRNSQFKEWIQSSDAKAVDKKGRTSIHNSVAVHFPPSNSEQLENYMYAIEMLSKTDIDIDHQDKSGKTALHYAALMNNLPGLKTLLKSGIDVNIVDSDGKPAFFYPLEYIEWTSIPVHGVVVHLCRHIWKLQYLKLDVSEDNKIMTNRVRKHWGYHADVSPKFVSQIELARSLDVGIPGLSILHFLTETRAVSWFPFMSKTNQDLIINFFKSTDFTGLEELTGVFNLQLRKMEKRLLLINPALFSLRTLLGFSFPGLCEEITTYLTNSELRNLIASTSYESKIYG